MPESQNRDALADAILTSLARWRDRPDQGDLHAADAEQLLSEYSPEESARLIDLGNAAADLIERSPDTAVDMTLKLATSACDSARALGCVLIARIGKFNPRTWLALIKHLAEDEASGVRDMVVHIFDTRAELAGWTDMHADYVFSICEEWREDSSYRVRRLVARALVGYASMSAQNAERVLKLLTPLYEDSAEFVRRNVVSALREIGKAQPDVIFTFLDARLQIDSPYDNEMIPLVLEASFARKNPDWRNQILAKL
ncbi:MAG: HEAT repeat domain-containing protein [bacterium]|nr:HEAT repeat domain-containing protein [bacterium]